MRETNVPAASSEVQILLVQGLYLALGSVQIGIVVNDVVGNGEALVTAGLRGQNTARLLDGLGIPRLEPPNLGVFAAVDNENAIDKGSEGRFDQKWHDYDLIIAAGLTGLTHRLPLDPRMQNRFQPRSGLVVGEYSSPHRLPVEVAVAGEDGVAEGFPDLIQRRLSGHDDLTRDDVGVYHRCTQRREHIGYDRLAAGNAAGESNP